MWPNNAAHVNPQADFRNNLYGLDHPLNGMPPQIMARQQQVSFNMGPPMMQYTNPTVAPSSLPPKSALNQSGTQREWSPFPEEYMMNQLGPQQPNSRVAAILADAPEAVKQAGLFPLESNQQMPYMSEGSFKASFNRTNEPSIYPRTPPKEIGGVKHAVLEPPPHPPEPDVHLGAVGAASQYTPATFEYAAQRETPAKLAAALFAKPAPSLVPPMPVPLVPFDSYEGTERDYVESKIPESKLHAAASINLTQFDQKPQGCGDFLFIPTALETKWGYGIPQNNGSSLDARMGNCRAMGSQGYRRGHVAWTVQPEVPYGWIQLGIAFPDMGKFGVTETMGFSRYKFREGFAWLSNRLSITPVRNAYTLVLHINGEGLPGGGDLSGESELVLWQDEQVHARLRGLPMEAIFHPVVQMEGSVVTVHEKSSAQAMRAYNQDIQRRVGPVKGPNGTIVKPVGHRGVATMTTRGDQSPHNLTATSANSMYNSTHQAGEPGEKFREKFRSYRRDQVRETMKRRQRMQLMPTSGDVYAVKV